MQVATSTRHLANPAAVSRAIASTVIIATRTPIGIVPQPTTRTFATDASNSGFKANAIRGVKGGKAEMKQGSGNPLMPLSGDVRASTAAGDQRDPRAR